MRRTLPRGTVSALSVGIVLLMAAGPAAAHVGVNPKSAEAGSWAKLTFRVPTERPDAATTKVEVVLPADQPVTALSVRPVPGWTVKAEKRTLSKPLTHGDKTIDEVVSRIVWSGGEINPGEFQEFDVSLGPLPEDGDRMVFKALQTYDSGEVVRWIEVPGKDGEEPERPAPVLTLTPAADEAGGSAASAPGEAAAAAKRQAGTQGDAAKAAAGPADGDEEKPASASGDTEDGTARLLGGAGLAAGLTGLLATLAVARRRPGRNSGRA